MTQSTSFTKFRPVCFVAMLLICLCAGFGYSWSVLQTPITAEFGWAAASVSLTYSITVAFSSLAPLAFGSIFQKIPLRTTIIIGGVIYGLGLLLTGFITQLWQLYLCYGVMSGLGVGMIYPTMMAYSVRLYPERAGFASGITTAFYGAGAVLWAPVMVALIDTASLKTAFNIIGICFAAVIIALAFFLRQPPGDFAPARRDSAAVIADDKSLRRREMVKTPKFYLTVVAFTLGLTAGLMVISQASPILQKVLTYTPAHAAIFVSVFALCNMAGRFGWGALSDKIGNTTAMRCVFCVCIASMLLLTLTSTPVLILIAMGLAASCYGGLASLLTPLTSLMFGAKYITENYGVMYVVFGLASLVAPNLAIAFVNATGSYTGAFTTAGVFAIAGLIITIPLVGKKAKE